MSGTGHIIGQRPVPFIVGVSRSGTTLLRLMLDAHPEMAIPPETHFIPGLIDVCARSADPHAAFIETLRVDPRWPDFHIDGRELERRVNSLGPFDVGAALRIFYLLYSERLSKPRWGDKTPPYLLAMDRIQQVLPEARFIHMIRDGRDVALSVNNLWFGPNSIQETAAWWMSRIQKAREQSAQLTHYIEVRYEDLLEAPEVVLRRVCDFIGLGWDPAMLNYYENAGARMGELGTIRGGEDRVLTAEQRRGIHALTNKPPQKERAGRWKHEFSPSDCASFESIAGPLLRELGYEVVSAV